MKMTARDYRDDLASVPLDEPALYDGVLSRRVFAFCIDYLLIALWTIPAAIVVFIGGIVTLGLGWMLFAVLIPLVALIYMWKTLGGPNQATTGMRMMGVHIMRLDGSRIDGPTAAIHMALFWLGNAVLTPLILLATLFTNGKRTIHDLLLGTVVVRDRPPL
jgi:uncharacterized RDD family membrane protein YckC